MFTTWILVFLFLKRRQPSNNCLKLLLQEHLKISMQIREKKQLFLTSEKNLDKEYYNDNENWTEKNLKDAFK